MSIPEIRTTRPLPEIRRNERDFAPGSNGGVRGRLETEYGRSNDAIAPPTVPANNWEVDEPEIPPEERRTQALADFMSKIETKIMKTPLRETADGLRLLTFDEKMEMCRGITALLPDGEGEDDEARAVKAFTLAVAINGWAKAQQKATEDEKSLPAD